MSNSCFSFKLPQLNSLSLRRGNSRSSLQQRSPENPYCIVIDFSAVTEKECGKLDTINEKKYNKLISKANKAERTIHRTGLSMNLEVPPPPHPSNRDRYIIWKKRNVSRKVIPQSEAIVFLTKNNYVLNEDYEAYQAIDLATEIKKDKGIQHQDNDKTHNFDNVYNHHDRNILRRRSMYRANKYPKQSEVQQPPNYQNTHEQTRSHPQQPQSPYPQPHHQPHPLPLPPSPRTVNLRTTSNQPAVLPSINPPNNQFYPQLPPPPSNEYEQYLPPQQVLSYPTAPPAPTGPPAPTNLKFRVSCSTHDGDSDTSF